MKRGYLAIIILGLILLSGCAVQQEIVCDKPYIQVGVNCCLDEDSNNVCDADEIKDKEEENEVITIFTQELSLAKQLCESHCEQQNEVAYLNPAFSQAIKDAGYLTCEDVLRPYSYCLNEEKIGLIISCEKSGGEWASFGTPCSTDDCHWLKSPAEACVQVIWDGCNCGFDKCWNETECIDKNIFLNTPEEELEEPIIDDFETCGNNLRDAGENCMTCPQDVRCASGEICSIETKACEVA
ncbi:MAG: hypothetical protein KJ939_00860 [Nanoarchaeota archaeon]|nr:hypothetical protein [Nanoarchaeota archaeon]MCG2719608.1 hypothetical protein [Nanoarchaeota archaeon]